MEQDLTLKELLVVVKQYVNYCFVNVKWIIPIVILTVSLFLYRHNSFQSTYSSEIKFSVKGQSGLGAGLSSLLGNLGITKSKKVNNAQIVEVAKSKKILKNSLIANDLGNTIIKEYGLLSDWKINNDYKFPNTTNEINTSLENAKVFQSLYGFVWGSPTNESLLQLKYDDDSAIFSLGAECVSDSLCLQLSKSIYDQIVFFFDSESLAKKKYSRNLLKSKLDSIKNLTQKKVYQLASVSDRSKDYIFSTDKTKERILLGEIQGLNTAYGEILKNFEIADFTLKQYSPTFTVIEWPMLPLYKKQSSLKKSIFLGLVIGIFIGVGFFTLKKYILENLMA